MHASPFVSFAVQLAVMAACGLVGGGVMRLLRQPAVLGEMLGGIVLGPTVFGLVAPDTYAGLFPATGPAAALRGSAVKLGMLFFMFTVGLEINPRSIRQNGLTALGVGLAGTLLPLAVGIGCVFAMPGLFPVADESLRFSLALFLGAALANSANPVLARILLDLGLLNGRLGAIIMSATVVDDLVSWGLVTLVIERSTHYGGEAGGGTFEADIGKIVVFFLVTLLVGLLASKWFAAVRHRRPDDVAGRIGMASILILLSAAAAERLGLHAFLGPFVLGIALAPPVEEVDDEAYAGIRRFAHGFFAPIYFVSLGLTTDFARYFSWPLVMAITVAASVSKIPAAYAGARFGGLDRRTAWAVGCGMNARGAIGIILANLGLEQGVIDQPTYVALVVMALATSLAAGPSMKACLAKA